MTASMREMYVVGRTGSFFVPTVLRLDAELRGLAARFTEPDLPDLTRQRIWSDIDVLLDRRRVLTVLAAANAQVPA